MGTNGLVPQASSNLIQDVEERDTTLMMKQKQTSSDGAYPNQSPDSDINHLTSRRLNDISKKIEGNFAKISYSMIRNLINSIPKNCL